MEITEKREGESNNSSKDLNKNDNINNDLTDSDGNNTSKEAEERRARDLKAGLHPLKVFLFFMIFLFFFFLINLCVMFCLWIDLFTISKYRFWNFLGLMTDYGILFRFR